MGKSNNIYENSYFNVNGIKVLFTECLQYGHFSTYILSDLHTNSEKNSKSKSSDSKLPGFKSSVYQFLDTWPYGASDLSVLHLFIQWNGHKNSNNLIGLSWGTKGLISENCWDECWHRLINANNHYYHLIILNFLLSCEFFPWSLVVSSSLVKIWFIVQWPS